MTYPNVLILGYYQASGTAAPEVQMKAESLVATGYQRLLTFEAPGGGFSLFGRGAEPNVFLSAYGLLQLSDMTRVYPVDEAVMERTAEWLLKRQAGDGSWAAKDYRAGKGALGTTAFVTWALAEAGYAQAPSLEQSLAYMADTAMAERDPYTLALVANAFVAAQPKAEATRQVLDRLVELVVRDKEGAHWPGEETMMGGRGLTGGVESTALAVHALLRAGRDLPLANEALAYIVRSKDSWGTWGSTQATIWALKALMQAVSLRDMRDVKATVRLTLNDGATQTLEFTPENADVLRVVTFDADQVPSSENRVSLELSGSGGLSYQVTTIYYLPWDMVPAQPEPEGLMRVDVSYDRTVLEVDDIVTASVGARLTQAGAARMVLLDLGIPPGFTVETGDLDLLVDEQIIARYELTGRQITIYIENLSSEEVVAFRYRLRARFPMRAKTQPYSAYDYYNPDRVTKLQPVLMTVGAKP